MCVGKIYRFFVVYICIYNCSNKYTKYPNIQVLFSQLFCHSHTASASNSSKGCQITRKSSKYAYNLRDATVCEHLDAICCTVLHRKRVRYKHGKTNSKKREKKKKENHLVIIYQRYLCCLRKGFSRSHARKSRRMTVSKERDIEGRPYRTLKILFFYTSYI